MIVTLERRGLMTRTPAVARSHTAGAATDGIAEARPRLVYSLFPEIPEPMNENKRTRPLRTAEIPLWLANFSHFPPWSKTKLKKFAARSIVSGNHFSIFQKKCGASVRDHSSALTPAFFALSNISSDCR
jgi:hypothetical protein